MNQTAVATLEVYVKELTTADTVEEKCRVSVKYFINIEGNWFMSPTLKSLYATLPNPCPRRQRGWEWERLDRIVDFNLMTPSEVLELRRQYCRYLGPNAYDSSVSYDEIAQLFGGCFRKGVQENDVKYWCEECLIEFQKLTSDEQVSWEIKKWIFSRVPRPEFLVVLLLMFQVISVVELGEEDDNELEVLHVYGDFRVHVVDRAKVHYVFSCLGFDVSDFAYLWRQLSRRRILKVFLHGFLNQRLRVRVRKRGLQFVKIVKERQTEDMVAYKRRWYQKMRAKMTEGTWL